jgi:hypothetical protein
LQRLATADSGPIPGEGLRAVSNIVFMGMGVLAGEAVDVGAGESGSLISSAPLALYCCKVRAIMPSMYAAEQ